jgi:hypothetical protein
MVEGTVVVDVRRVFTLGLPYLMLWRVCSRAQLRLVTQLTLDMFDPITLPPGKRAAALARTNQGSLLEHFSTLLVDGTYVPPYRMKQRLPSLF